MVNNLTELLTLSGTRQMHQLKKEAQKSYLVASLRSGQGYNSIVVAVVDDPALHQEPVLVQLLFCVLGHLLQIPTEKEEKEKR